MTLNQHLVKFFALEHIKPDPLKPSLGLISRQRKRFLLNQREMIMEAQQLGVHVTVLPLELMTFYEQFSEIRKLHILAGVHGSGLTNGQFLSPGTVLLQLMPYKVTSGATFFAGFPATAGAKYMEWSNTHRDNTVFHWHFVDRATFANRKSLITDGGSGGGSSYFGFWIQQDTVVDIDEWRQLLGEAFRAAGRQLK